MSNPIHHLRRRTLLGGVGGLSLAGLAACSSGETPSSAAGSSAGSADVLPAAKIQIGWLPNVENMAVITAVADGLYTAAGTTVEILPGGPDVVADAQIVSGNALLGILSAEALANSVLAGAPLVAIAATYQTASSCILSLTDSGITEPKDLEGRRFGMSQTDARVYTPFFELAGVDISKIDVVSTGADPASLVSGEVDAMSATLPNQPVAVRAQGYATNQIRLADYGYNRWSGLVVVRQDNLDKPTERATIIAVLGATIEAMETAVADPGAAAQTVFDVYGEQLGLVLPSQVEGAGIWAELATENTHDQGVMRVTGAGVAGLQDFFDTTGIDVTAADLFDLSVQEEV